MNRNQHSSRSGHFIAWTLCFLVYGCDPGDSTEKLSAVSQSVGGSLATVSIDPGPYTGVYKIEGQTAEISGLQSVSLPTDVTHRMLIAGAETKFSINADGSIVTSYTAALETYPGLIKFKTTTVDVDPGAFRGEWFFSGNGTGISGSRQVVVVPSLTYRMLIAGVSAFVSVDQSGFVTPHSSAAMAGGYRSVIFNTLPLSVNVAGYASIWNLAGVDGEAPGSRTFDLVPGLSGGYRIVIANSASAFFTFGPDGQVTSTRPSAMAGGLGTLTFITAPIQIDPGQFTGTWAFHGIDEHRSGVRTISLLPGLSGYRIWVGDGGSMFLRVEPDETVVVLTPGSAIGELRRLTFNTVRIELDPAGYTGVWSLEGITGSKTGVGDALVVPGLTYRIWIGTEQYRFSVAAPCAISPGAPQFTISGHAFSITCGSLDQDRDGVPDLTDNCAGVPNPDQMDSDVDQVGDMCDDDRDGDMITNTNDNCADVANSNQSDQDLDGIGDICDSDTDGDGALDSTDNCKGLFNPDQLDGDFDLLGDACDSDDDGDAVQDDVDNCPTVPNPLQADFNGNGQGDACDGNVDGDSVANADDACPLTPLGLAVDTEGCSGSQFIARQCIRVAFVQHGQYVKCVAHAASVAVANGTMPMDEKSSYVREAARMK